MLSLLKLRNRANRELHNLIAAKTNSRLHFLLISSDKAICQSQIFPFYFYKDKLLRDFGITFTEIDIDNYLTDKKHLSRKCDVVFFQPWYDRAHSDFLFAFKKIKRENTDAKLVFLDSYAPLDLRFAELVNPWVDIYVKKQILSDKAKYGTSTIGDTNLSDYYGKLYSLNLAVHTHNIPPGFIDKLVIGSGFDMSSRIAPFINKSSLPSPFNRNIDLHARLSSAGEGWYRRMRAHANTTVLSLHGIKTVTGASVPYRKYIKEMQNSKICFSPFGFGEVCWRDYEAIMCGALLIKPDMSHVTINPNIFRPFETFIPVKWDFSDVQEKIQYYLADKEESAKITSNAYEVLRKNAGGESFFSSITEILKKCGISKS
jgi:Glycosyl transferases group 1